MLSLVDKKAYIVFDFGWFGASVTSNVWIHLMTCLYSYSFRSLGGGGLLNNIMFGGSVFIRDTNGTLLIKIYIMI